MTRIQWNALFDNEVGNLRRRTDRMGAWPASKKGLIQLIINKFLKNESGIYRERYQVELG
jgi:hypothetical protein